MSNGRHPREPEIPSPDQQDVPDPRHRYDVLQVLQTMMELQKDITMIGTKTDRLIIDVDKLDQKVDRVIGTLTLAKGFGIAALILIPICATVVWWLVGAKIEQVLAVRPSISQSQSTH
ncbi:MAG: hypothetical protein CR217_14170 [Beijerinckiaceae bacterium]|nr:MAG: hypothetical protein CR217_14170 [Beijerinckiaceae bacterium]